MGFLANYLRNLVPVALGRHPFRPLLVSYYVTHRCDLACRYCCDGDGKRFKEEPIPELPTSEANRLLSILREATDTLDVTGGEPMLREDLEEILAHARQVKFRTIVNTKGIGLRTRPDLMRFTDVLVLSLDTLDPTELAKLIGRPAATAEEVLDALHFAVETAPVNGTRVVLSAVATPANLDQVAKVLTFAMEHSLGFHLSPEIVGTRANPELRGNPRYSQLVEEVMRSKAGGVGVLGVPQYLTGIRDFRPFRCYPLLMPVIRPDGRMYYPCLESKQAEVNLLDSGDYWAALEAVRQRYGELPECSDCCHIFCHMALSLLQRHPLSALAEIPHLRARRPGNHTSGRRAC